ncbi:MAG TPA: helix-hairpin-helix domain-containing protein [Flavisolibacter sp.]|nr:helix-hairpin-helix domain-containing protein [Flavisolibacter sp.]
MNTNEFFRSYFGFDKKDRLGALLLLMIILALYALPKVFPKKASTPILEDTAVLAAIDTLKSTTLKHIENDFPDKMGYVEKNYVPDYTTIKPFHFNPNTLDLEGWKRLGLPERNAKTIINYRNKGGKFYKREDLQKIWGLPAGFYDHVSAFIDLPASFQHAQFKSEKETFNTPKKEKIISHININEADTSALIALPGIGSKLASRIINFRDKLGGFYTPEQIRETYGVPDSTFQKIKHLFKIDPQLIRKINANTASKDQLKNHPYIKWHIANAIVEYRNQHGPFKELAELKRIVLIDESLFQKISPYLSF